MFLQDGQSEKGEEKKIGHHPIQPRHSSSGVDDFIMRMPFFFPSSFLYQKYIPSTMQTETKLNTLTLFPLRFLPTDRDTETILVRHPARVGEGFFQQKIDVQVPKKKEMGKYLMIRI